MKLLILSLAASIPLLTSACADHEVYKRYVEELQARQEPSSSSPTPTSSGNTTTSQTQISVSLISQNPTAVSLVNITAGQPSSATIALSTTFAAGQTPSAIANAPALPDISGLAPKNYPPLDKTPPTDSDEVKQWIQDVANTGVVIPDLSVNTNGASLCASNPDASKDTSRCWWTCGGCTRDEDVVDCPTKMNWGVTYDDGPSFYTPNLLQYLDQQQLKTTFFSIGSRALQFPNTLRDEYMAGHQIGVHTWSHPPLTTMTNDQIIAELGWTKKIMRDVLGVTPNTFRPPYGDIDDRVRAIALAMDLRPVIWTRLNAQTTFDTGDFNINSGLISSSQVVANWNNIMNNASTINNGFIVLEHDLFAQTVEIATGYILPEALAHEPKFNLTPVVTCMGLNLADAYVETNNNETNPAPSFSSTSVTGAQSTGGPGGSSGSGAMTFNPIAPLQALGASMFAGLVGAGLLL